MAAIYESDWDGKGAEVWAIRRKIRDLLNMVGDLMVAVYPNVTHRNLKDIYAPPAAKDWVNEHAPQVFPQEYWDDPRQAAKKVAPKPAAKKADGSPAPKGPDPKMVEFERTVREYLREAGCDEGHNLESLVDTTVRKMYSRGLNPAQALKARAVTRQTFCFTQQDMTGLDDTAALLLRAANRHLPAGEKISAERFCDYVRAEIAQRQERDRAAGEQQAAKTAVASYGACKKGAKDSGGKKKGKDGQNGSDKQARRAARQAAKHQ